MHFLGVKKGLNLKGHIEAFDTLKHFFSSLIVAAFLRRHALVRSFAPFRTLLLFFADLCLRSFLRSSVLFYMFLRLAPFTTTAFVGFSECCQIWTPTPVKPDSRRKLLLQGLLEPKICTLLSYSTNLTNIAFGDRSSRTIPTKDLPHQVVFWEEGVCEVSEPKRKANYAPPPVLHSQCRSSILWGWCVDFTV